MSSPIRQALANVDVIKHQLDSAETELAQLIKPILAAYGIEKVYIEWANISHSRNILSVRYGWSSRGYSNSNDIEIPMSVIDSPDPVFAVQELIKQQKIEKEAADRAKKMAQLEQLQVELGLTTK